MKHANETPNSARIRVRGALMAVGGSIGVWSLWPLGLMDLLERQTKDRPPSDLGGLLAALMGVPFVLVCVGILELATGRPFRRISAWWDRMNEWKQGLFSLLAFCLGIAFVGALLYLAVRYYS